MAKSPFVTKETHTYHYPEPFDQAKEDELAAVLAARGVEDPDAQRRIDPEELEAGHWLTVRIPRSSEDVDRVADATQSLVLLSASGDASGFEQRIAMGNREVFELLAETWSFDGECNGANYSRLGLWSGDWIRACLGDAVTRGTSRDYAKKMNGSSKTPETSVDNPSSPEPLESVSK